MRGILFTALLFIFASAPFAAGAENDNLGSNALCRQCAGKAFTMDIGKCSSCGRETSSGAFKLCQACALKQGKCQACNGPLAVGEKKPDDPVKIPEKDEAAFKALHAWIAVNVKPGGEGPRPMIAETLKNPAELTAPVLATAFPAARFFRVRFMMFPVAVAPPEPLGQVNLFAVAGPDKEGNRAVTLIKTPEELQAFCAGILRADKADAARVAAYAYGVLRAELVQDGFYRFEIKPESFTVSEKGGAFAVSAHIAVAPGGGNAGSMEIEIAIDPARFKVVKEKVALKSGMRPICQSLRLLSPNMAERESAERDLLIMGKNALPYLRMMTGRTEGDLRSAIQTLSARIEAGEGGPRHPDGQPEAGMGSEGR